MLQQPRECHHCGMDPRPPKQGRSVQQNRRYWAMIKAYYHHWPESHDFQPIDAEELRHWLQAKAGHRDVAARIPVIGLTREQVQLIAEGFMAAARKTKGYAFPVPYGSDLVVITSKSIAFKSLPHKEACALFDEVAAVAEAETGLNAEAVMKETRNEA